ncbi:MAG: DUF1573 domain-containing protein [Bacteroidales bacterium]|nr:DUF1573 domain-containing protein [Candidatus Liminaster caballi]
MINRRFTLILIMTLTAALSLAAGKLSFTKTSHDFGTILEKDGDASTEFEFENTGDSPLLITRAASSCGCTVPEYPKQPIRPGQKGVIKVTYHAKGRPGPFQKSIQVYDNNDHRTTISIMGNVVSTVSPEDTYANAMGAGLRSKGRTLNFFDVYPNRVNRTRSLQFYNEGDEPIQLTFRNVSKNIYLESEPEIILPKQEGKVLVTFLTAKAKDWGMHRETFEVFVKGKEAKMKNNQITITADIWEDFSEMNRKERDNAGEIEIEETSIDFGTGATQPVTKTITIRNTGKSKLTLRKVCNDMPEVFRTQLGSTTIKPGASTTLKVTYIPSANKVAQLTHHLTIISNDPGNSRVIINVIADK